MKITKKHTVIALLVISLIIAAAASVTIAKYVSDYDSGKAPATPDGFYFDTELTEGTSYIAIENSVFTFSVRNHDLFGHYTNEAITFNVQAGEYSLPADYTLDGGRASDIEVSIPLAETRCVAGDAITVTLTTKSGSSPFMSELSFSLNIVNSAEANYYSVIDRGSYVELTLNIGSSAPESLTVVYGTLAPDNTNALMSGWLTANGQGVISDGLEAHASYTLRFFGSYDVPTVSGSLVAQNNVIDITGGGAQ